MPVKLWKCLLLTYGTHCIPEEKFKADFKEAEVCPIHKNDGRADNPNYWPISIFPNVAKIYEKCLHSQSYNYFNYFPIYIIVQIYKCQCDF